MTSFPPFQPTLYHLVFLLLSWLFLLSYLTTPVFGSNHNNNIQCIHQERQALLQFKQGIQDDYCGLLSSWSNQEEHRDCCQWRGVSCSNRTGHVIALNLRGTPLNGCLEGEVRPSLLELKHLKHLDLSSNTFQGSIPSFIGSLLSLKHLNLSNAGFYGEIPHQLGNLSNLTSLDLNAGDRYFLLHVKSMWWLSRMTSLRYIDLSKTNLSKAATDHWLQSVNNLPFLRVLRMDDCHLSPTIPSSLSYVNSSNTLRVLSLAGNHFNKSSIFKWLFNLSGISTHLVYLDFSENWIPGPIPSAFGNLQALSYLDLSWNQLKGPIPSVLGNMHALSYLDFSHNQLEGPIPIAFGNMHALSYLRLSHNQLEGPIPVAFGNMHALSYLHLSHNQLEGPAPKTLGNLCSLQILDLGKNNVVDDLSSIIQAISTRCAHKRLEVLYLDHNQICGSIPNIISTYSSLRILRLNVNQLNGTISQNLGQLSMLEYLDLSSNSLKGTLSNVHFSNLSRLTKLDLSRNPALGVSGDWIPPFTLETVNLGSCKLGPDFPKWLQSQRNFTILDISDAQISDTIPDSFWNSLPSQLQYLNMSHNNFHGTLSDLSSLFFDPLKNYVIIDMSFNYFAGAIPSFPSNVIALFLHNNKLTDATPLLCPNSTMNLLYLDLSNNLLSGELPDCWMLFVGLSILLLENNRFYGKIPPSIGTMKDLRWLQLRNNSFSGELPVSLENCTSLVRLNLGYNSFTGYIPAGIGDTYTNLGFLSLHRNNFIGGIPLSICRLSFLQILDLSFNNISGTIPNCVYNLTAMTTSIDVRRDSRFLLGISSIDALIIMWKRKEQSFGESVGLVKYIALSGNKLEGQIPVGITSLVELVSLDLSRNNLSGSITYKIGEMRSLEFLDLSYNHLSGEIPTSLATLSSLEMLDLSNNNLSGKIPMGTQLQSFDAASYQANPRLCGDPLPKCPEDQATHDIPKGEDTVNQHHDKGNDDIFPGLYISIILGFIIGFWGVCGTLVIKRSWRQAFYRYFDDMRDKLYVIVVLNMARIRRAS